MAEGVTRYASERAAKLLGEDFEGDLDELEGAIMVAIDDAQVQALEDLKASGCPHACLAPCPFHRKIDERIAKLGRRPRRRKA